MDLSLAAVRVQQFRRRFAELSATQFSNRQVLQFCHAAEMDFARRTASLTDARSLATVANQQKYDLPEDVLGLKNLTFDPVNQHQKVWEVSEQQIVQVPYRTGTPDWYALMQAQRQLMLHPAPSAAAATTTLTGDHTISVTTLTVAATTSFGSRGRVKIDDEIISYTATTATTLTGCLRGQEGTVAATHAGAATVTWQNLEAQCFVKPKPLTKLYAAGTIAVTTVTKTVTGTSTVWNTGNTVAVGDWFGVGSLETTPTGATFPLVWYKIDSIASDTSLTLELAYREATETAGSYLITDQSSFPEDVGECILVGMLSLGLFAVRSPLYTVKKAEYLELVQSGRTSLMPDDWLPVNRPRGAAESLGPEFDNDYAPVAPW